MSAFLDSARCCTPISDDIFRSALTGIVQRYVSQQRQIHGQLGEHVIVNVPEDGSLEWYLGVIEHNSSSVLSISLLVPTDLNKKIWEYPLTQRLIESTSENIMASKVKVHYFSSPQIRLKIVSEELITNMNSAIERLQTSTSNVN